MALQMEPYFTYGCGFGTSEDGFQFVSSENYREEECQPFPGLFKGVKDSHRLVISLWVTRAVGGSLPKPCYKKGDAPIATL